MVVHHRVPLAGAALEANSRELKAEAASHCGRLGLVGNLGHRLVGRERGVGLYYLGLGLGLGSGL